MEWDKDSLKRLSVAISERWSRFVSEKKTDRRNLSELWAKHLLELDIIVVRPAPNVKRPKTVTWDAQPILSRLVDIINNNNGHVAGALCVPNPDRPAQLVLVPRDLAAKILVVGMP